MINTTSSLAGQVATEIHCRTVGKLEEKGLAQKEESKNQAFPECVNGASIHHLVGSKEQQLLTELYCYRLKNSW